MYQLKKVIKRVIYCIDYILILGFGEKILVAKNIQCVHLSMDDVFEILRGKNHYIIESMSEIHMKYGILVHLYCLHLHNKSVIQTISPELTCYDWIDYGPHQPEYIEEIYQKLDGLNRSKYIRLHEFKATPEQINKLIQGGGCGLLTADTAKRASYDLKYEMIEKIAKKGTVTLENLKYIKTDIRLERLIFLQLLRKRGKNNLLTIFTHEQKYGQVESRLRLLCEIFDKLSILYI